MFHKPKLSLGTKALLNQCDYRHRGSLSAIFKHILNANTKSSFGPGGKEVLQELTQVIFVGECFKLQGIVQGKDQMIVGGPNVCL